MVYLSEDHFVTAHSSANPAALRVPQGEVVKVKTKDCYSNGLRAENDPRGEAPCPVNACNPATGAIFVRARIPGIPCGWRCSPSIWTITAPCA